MTLEFACERFVEAEEALNLTSCSCKYDVVRDRLGDDGIGDILDNASDAVAYGTGLAITGRCTTTFRPCSDGVCGCIRGRAFGLYHGCACCDIDGVKLPQYAVDIAVTQVKVDGVVVDPSLYALVDGRILVRRDGRSWPGIQNVAAPDTEEHTFSITIAYGRLPWIAKMAAAEMACDAFALVTGGDVKLPASAVSAIMDGVTVNLDPSVLGTFPWMQRLMGQYPPGPQPLVYSPGTRGRYTLHTVE